MDDVTRVCSGKGFEHEARHMCRRNRTEVAPSQPVFQRLAVEPFHRNVGRPVGSHAVVEIANDSGMRQLRQHPRLLVEARLLDGAARMQDFERDQISRVPVECLIHRPHAADTGLALELIALRKAERASRGTRCHRTHDRHRLMRP